MNGRGYSAYYARQVSGYKKDLGSAIVATLEPGNYTAIVSGKNGGTGIALVEAYDLDNTVDSQSANIGTRGFVETEDNVMIGGFILGGASGASSRVVVRAIGPSLGALGVAGALSDPTLELKDANGSTVMSNDDWRHLHLPGYGEDFVARYFAT
jgi:hypothetical protein